MNPTVEAAWIAAGTGGLGIISTATVALLSGYNTRRTNSQNIQAATENTIRALSAARADQLWEQQRSAYREISAYLLYIQAKRRHDNRSYQLDDQGEQALLRLLGDYKPENWWELQARLAHYGSEEAIARFEASYDADRQVAACGGMLADLMQQAKDAATAGNLAGKPEMSQINAARKELRNALKRAGEVDEALIKLMRAEISRMPALLADKERLSG